MLWPGASSGLHAFSLSWRHSYAHGTSILVCDDELLLRVFYMHFLCRLEDLGGEVTVTPLPSLEEADAAQASQNPHLPPPRRNSLHFSNVELFPSKVCGSEGARPGGSIGAPLYSTRHLLVRLMGYPCCRQASRRERLRARPWPCCLGRPRGACQAATRRPWSHACTCAWATGASL